MLLRLAFAFALGAAALLCACTSTQQASFESGAAKVIATAQQACTVAGRVEPVLVPILIATADAQSPGTGGAIQLADDVAKQACAIVGGIPVATPAAARLVPVPAAS